MNIVSLYKKDSKGKIRVWRAYTVGDKLVQESGILDGKLKQDAKTCTPKNVGKANQTTGEEQAELEKDSKVEAKLKEGYFRTIEEAQTSLVVLPMLAKEYGKEKHKIDWDTVYVQPKLDGMRCFAIIENGEVRLMSRKGTPIETLPHIVEAIKALNIVNASPAVIFDGELYAHGKTFQENMSLIKKYREGETEEIRYHIYDMVSDSQFVERYNTACDLLQAHLPETILCPVPTSRIAEEYLTEVHKQNIAVGFEGTMIRWSKAGYQLDKRSSYLLKYKDFKDEACAVIDVVPSDARPEQGVLVCTTFAHGDGLPVMFKASIKGTHAQREELLKNKEEYISRMAEIRFFEYTDEGKPRFPVCVGFREDK